MIRKNILLGLAMYCCNFIFAQRGHNFLILDDVTAIPFENVDITVYDTTKTKIILKTKTDKKGVGTIENLEDGKYKVILSKEKYISIEKEVEINVQKSYKPEYVEILIPIKKTKSAIIRDGVPPPENRISSEIKENLEIRILPDTDFPDKKLYLAYTKDDKPIYVDKDKKIKLEPNFKWCDKFSEGLALVEKDRKYGYINYNGELQIPCIYDRGEPFSNGVAIVQVGDSIGAIDKNNKMIIPFGNKPLSSFSYGLSCFYSYEGNNISYSYIDKRNKLVVDKKYIEVKEMKNGYANVIKKGGNENIMDSLGKEISDFDFHYKFHFCDEKRNFEGFKEGYCPVSDKYGYVNYIDTKGKLLFKDRQDYRAGDYFSEGLAAVDWIYYGKFIYIDTLNNQYFIDLKLEGAKAFKEGLAPVKKDELWGYIDKNGTVVIPFQFSDASPFSEGLAIVKKDNKYGYIDKSGKLVIDYKFNYVQPFKKGFAQVGESEYNYFFINKKGKCVFLCE